MTITEWEVHRTPVGQKQINIILCDDDQVFLKKLQAEVTRTFSKLNSDAVIALFDSPMEMTEGHLKSCDLIFLDVDFENETYTGIDIARRLREVNRSALIFFVTNFINYAPAGYEVQAFRYILKRDLSEVLDRYILQAMEMLAEKQEFLRLQSRDEIIDLSLDEILFLEVMDHSVSVHTAGSTYVMAAALARLENELEPHGFLRIHKSYLANMQHIRKFRSRECLLDDGTKLSVSEKNYSGQKQKYLLWKGFK